MSHPEQDSPQDLAAAYALGALTPEEARRYEAFLVGSPEAQREVADYRDVAALLALGDSGAAPPAELRRRVLDRVRTERQREVLRPPRALWIALAASLVATVGLGFAVGSMREQLHSLRAALADSRVQLAESRARLAEREATLNSLFEPGVQLIQLTASGDPDPGIQLFYDRERHRALVHGFRLAAVPQGQAYQLWFIKDGAPVPSVTFTPEPDGHVKVEGIPVPADGPLSAAAVTVEPESGSAQPTSPIVMVGTFGGR